MAAINFPTATSNGQTFTADTGVIYTYIGTPPNGFWSGTFGTTGLATLDGRFVALNDGNSIQTMQTQGLKFNNGSADTILLDGVNGKVGIGTTSPDTTLDVRTSSGETYIKTNNGTASNFFGIDSSNRGFLGTVSNHPLIFATNDSEKVRIDSSGRVGIGTTSPNSASQLHVLGSNYNPIVVDSSNSGGAGVLFHQSGTAALYVGTGGSSWLTGSATTDGLIRANQSLLFATSGNNERMRIDSSGNVGIGTSTFPVNGTNLKTSDGTIARHILEKTGANARVFEIGNGGTFLNIYDATADSERMRIDSSGNVGIGTGSIDASLHVKGVGTHGTFVLEAGGTSGASNQIYIQGHNNAGTSLGELHFEETATNQGAIVFKTNGGSVGERMRIDSSGRLLLNGGTDVRIELGTTGTTATNNRNHIRGDGSSLKYNTCSGGLHVFEQNGTERMRIDSSGRLGVGFSSPPATFSVHALGTDSTTGFFKSGVANVFLQLGNSVNDQGYLGYQSSVMTFYTAGDLRMRIDDTGRINIGGSGFNDTRERLRIQSPSGSDTFVTIKAPSNSGESALFFGDSDFNRGAVSYEHSGDNMLFRVADAERMRIDSSGRLLVGNTGSLTTNGQDCALQVVGSTAAKSRIAVINRGNDATGGGIQIVKSRGTIPQSVTTNDQVGGIFWCAGDGNDYASQAARIECYIDALPGGSDTPGRLTFSTTPDQTDSPVERMRIAASGRVIVNDTNSESYAEAFQVMGNHGGQYAIAAKISGTSGYLIRFGNSINVVGSITCSTNSTAYNTSSDYRLKENVVNLDGAIPRLKTLPVHRFNFIADSETTVDGFLAHEAQLVVPEAVTGTHNELDGDGNPVMQAIDQAKLVPLLTAALQEAIGRIETLETEVAALKAG